VLDNEAKYKRIVSEDPSTSFVKFYVIFSALC